MLYRSFFLIDRNQKVVDDIWEKNQNWNIHLSEIFFLTRPYLDVVQPTATGACLPRLKKHVYFPWIRKQPTKLQTQRS